MADNVTLPGTGEVVAADDCGGAGKVQLFKLAVSTDGSATLVPATANGLVVQGQAAHDDAQAGQPLQIGGRASAAAPSDVSADNDAVRLWALRNGSLVVNLAAAGALIPGDATNGLKVQPSGNVAHDAADSGNPIKVGAKAESAISGITLVADGDRTDLYADLDGVQMMKPDVPYGDYLVERISNTNGTSTDLTTFGATASARNMIDCIVGVNTSAAFAYVDIRDGAAGSVIATLPLPPGGGFIFQPKRAIRQPTANTALAFDVSAATTTVYLTFFGYKSKV